MVVSNLLVAGLFKQVDWVWLCYFTTSKFQICHTEYMFLTHGGSDYVHMTAYSRDFSYLCTCFPLAHFYILAEQEL
jgi:hypothetical protein